MDTLKEHISSIFGLNEGQADIFLSGFRKTEFRKNEIFSKEGQICNKIGLIQKGLMKCIYPNNGDEVIFEFAFEHHFISDYYSFVTQTSSEKQITCLENCTVYVINRQGLEELAKTHAFIESMSRKMNEMLFLLMHDKLKSILLDTVSQRYSRLIAERQDLVQRIPQYLLASYLNVKPETISRVRKKISGL